MKRKSTRKRQRRSLNAALQKLQQRLKVEQAKLNDVLSDKQDAEESLRALLCSTAFKKSQIAFSKRLLFEIENDLRVEISEMSGLTAKQFMRSLDEEVFRLIHGGRIPRRILISPDGVMKAIRQNQEENHGKFNYAGIAVTMCESIKKHCFIIQSEIGKVSVAGERGWAVVATAGYDTA